MAAFGTALGLLGSPSVARAHPLGTSSINRYLDFQYETDARFRVAYLLDFAEGPAYAEIDALDADHDGAVTPAEQRRYLDSRLPVLVSTCVVAIDGARATPSIVASHVETPPGEGGLQTMRIAAELSVVGRAPGGHDVVLEVHDDGFAGVAGWREIHADDTRTPGVAASARLAVEGAITPTRTVDARFTFPARSAARLEPAWRSRLVAPALGLALASLAVVAFLRRRRAR